MQQPTYLSPSGDSLTRYQKSRDFQTEEQPRMTEAPQKPFDSYSKSVLVRAPRKQFYLPGVSKHKERPDKSAAKYRPTVGKESKNMNSAPIIHLPESSGSNFDLSPQRSSSYVGVEASDSQDQVFSKKLPLRSHLFSVEPFSSQQPSSHDGYLPNQRVRVSRPSIGAQAQHEKSGLSRQNRVSAIQEPKLMNDYAPIQRSRGLDSTQRGISSQIDDVQTSYPANSPPNSKLEVFSRLFGNEVISENFEVRNTSSGRFPSGDTHKKKRNPQGISLNDESVGDTTTDPLHILTQPTNVQKRLVNVNRKLSTTASRPSKTLSTSKVSASTPVGVFWRKSGNTKRLPPQRGSKASPKPINTYVKQSRNSYVRSKVFLSKSRYSPYQHAEDKTIKDQWKSDPAQEKAPLFDGGGEKWWKNQLFQ
ncbi:uncharacterized protein LOC133954974 [Platichthys flesus]|uniref:uncharacterized protein LOC133954974 n=1 Tax=Platichthys flesus TaxID=8260 RepID=UPI002DB679E3|nr:uncharacterized protein LOC133954974 [Platichthys flesus]XP_062245580.1 uncharacterized protein LOC133954974 [Platichthys flesus]XP_062245581.1 uncharacterized protein LOC133954974 [Platichthys flesus]